MVDATISQNVALLPDGIRRRELYPGRSRTGYSGRLRRATSQHAGQLIDLFDLSQQARAVPLQLPGWCLLNFSLAL
jgi:hypothetical protein